MSIPNKAEIQILKKKFSTGANEGVFAGGDKLHGAV